MESSGPTRRVLIVTKSDGVGGIERNLSWFVPSLRERGIDCDLVVLQPAVGGPELFVDLDPVLLSGGGAGARSMIRRLWALRSLARDYDVVIGTGPVANQLVCLAAARARRIVAEGSDPFIDRRQRWNRRWGWVLRRADAVVVHTRELAEEVRAAGNYPAKVAVIPNAVDPSACAVAPSPERRRERDLLGSREVLALEDDHAVGPHGVQDLGRLLARECCGVDVVDDGAEPLGTTTKRAGAPAAAVEL